MKQMPDQLKSIIQNLQKKDFFTVFFSNIVAKTCTFLGGVILVRIFSKTDYGSYAYVINCYSMLFIANDLGSSVAMMQYRGENYKNSELSNSYFAYSLKYGMAAGLLSGVVIFASPLFYPYSNSETAGLTQALCFLPFLSILNSIFLSNIRVLLLNKSFSRINIFSTVVNYAIILPVSYFFSVNEAVICGYFIQGCILLYTLYESKKCSHGSVQYKERLTKGQKIQFIKFALASQFNNSIGALFNLFDLFVIGLLISGTEIISSYKAASAIPQALLFIPNSLMMFTVPYFARNYRNIPWIWDKYKKLTVAGVIINAAISTMLVAASKFLVPWIFGNAYSDIVPCFQILIVSFFFTATFHIPAANIIYTMHKIKINIAVTVVSNIMNCVLDFILIGKYGSIGAAYATLFVSVVTSFLFQLYLITVLRKKTKNV